ncbi:M1 family metallopeptidase [Sphingobium sp. DEHP117]|uniref:M1 family metallopeptidase n=1 Tax=Sphingobium sp. DEHP117 TaxID=2993436 RepID=UPI0027D705E1|nr:M1 family aminopeptidase [Sphingobium sp. DEHP117]MDQ4420084.1 M1 family metallopeptidase [Sphingobium sp. DEHP117]
MSFSPVCRALSLSAAPLALAFSSFVAPALAQPQAAPVAEVTTQLPRVAVPSHYAIRMAPDAANLKFSAEAQIDIALSTATNAITLNAADLAISSATIAMGKGKPVSGTIATDAAAQTVTVTFPKSLKPGNYKLAFAYTGVINTQANGLFALDYTDGAGASKRALFTQFEAPDARRFVPSWDEPSYKATFDLSVVVPKGQMAVSNMPIASSVAQKDGTSLVTFGTSPKMSTYLLFLGMGELERMTTKSGPTELGVITGKGNVAKAQLALDAAAQILPYYNDYFGVPFPLPKLDNVAGPGQSQFFSAMENWGAIFTFERALLVDPKSTSEASKRRVYEIVAHETAHQWFGNLVTMAWWDDLWLNEGFASWMATKVTDVMQPEWETLLTRVDGREQAMSLDAYVTTHPVVQHVKTVEEANQAFDAITYEKGEAVITMLENFAGADTWRDGIRAYMKKHAYGNTVTTDLWSAVEAAGAKGLSTIAHDFTSQPGIPLVKVDSAQCVNGTTRLALSQSEFSRDAKEAKDNSPLSWHVPVKAQVLGGAEQSVILQGKATIELQGCGPYVINKGQAGYYRTLYPADNVSALASDFTKLASIDQKGVLADNWQLGLGGYQPMARSLDLVDAVPATASTAILTALPDYLAAAHEMFEGDAPSQQRLLAYASAKLTPILTRIGMDVKEGEGAQTALLRQSLIATLGDMGDAAVVAEAQRRYAALATNPAALDGPMKFVWLRIVARNADQPTWDNMRKMANAAPTALEKSQLFSLLGRAKDEKLATQALNLAMTNEPGKTTSADIISSVADEHSALAVDFALAHLDDYLALIDSSARNRAIGRLGAGSADIAMADKLAAYAEANLSADARKTTDRVIAAVRARAAARTRLKPEVLAWLDGKASAPKAVSARANKTRK